MKFLGNDGEEEVSHKYLFLYFFVGCVLTKNEGRESMKNNIAFLFDFLEELCIGSGFLFDWFLVS